MTLTIMRATRWETTVVTRDMPKGMTVGAIRARHKRVGECSECDRHRDIAALLGEIDRLRTQAARDASILADCSAFLED